MLTKITESQLSVIWDTKKTKHYPQIFPIYLIREDIGIVYMWRYQEAERRVLSDSGLYCVFGQSLLFFFQLEREV